MKMKKFLLSAFALVFGVSLASCGGDNTNKGGNPGTEDTTEKYTATIWVSETAGVAELTQKQVEKFNKENPDYSIKATINGISESEAASQMILDVESGADIYCFAQDQLNRLVNAGALSKLGVKASETVKAANYNEAIGAASVNGELYCYPITADNGYFMIYNKSVISEKNLNDLEAIVAECEEKGYNF